ncbi:MAG: response regulator transcription factor [bacterium]|nr:response regulator transcription factor [bacterium]
MLKPKILVVDDEKDIVELIRYNLEKEGYRVISANDGTGALKLAEKEVPNLIVLDLMLPELDGLEVCKLLKRNVQTASIPILMVTAKSTETDKVVGLELGADDYVTKPFSPRELVARIKAILRRTSELKSEPVSETIKVGQLKFDFAKYIVTVNNRAIDLTSKEIELLKTLIAAKGRVLTRDYLLDRVWGIADSSEIETRTIDVHIAQLRKKLGSEGARIITVKNVGYRFDLET